MTIRLTPALTRLPLHCRVVAEALTGVLQSFRPDLGETAPALQCSRAGLLHLLLANLQLPLLASSCSLAS